MLCSWYTVASVLTAILLSATGCLGVEKLDRTPDPDFGVEPVSDVEFENVDSIWAPRYETDSLRLADVYYDKKAGKTVRVRPGTDLFYLNLLTTFGDVAGLTEVYLVKDLTIDPKAEESNAILLRDFRPNNPPYYLIRQQRGGWNNIFEERVDVRDQISKHSTFVGVMTNKQNSFERMLKKDNNLNGKRPAPKQAPRRKDLLLSLDKKSGEPFYYEGGLRTDRKSDEQNLASLDGVIDDLTDEEFKRAYRGLSAGERDAAREERWLRREDEFGDSDDGLRRVQEQMEHLNSLETGPPLYSEPSFKEEEEEEDNWAVRGIIKAIHQRWIYPGEEFYLYSLRWDEDEGEDDS